jgi:hypothetical protein
VILKVIKGYEKTIFLASIKKANGYKRAKRANSKSRGFYPYYRVPKPNYYLGSSGNESRVYSKGELNRYKLFY